MATLKQLKARRAKLVAALRSGKYEQEISKLVKIKDYSSLKSEMVYCCLGVACKVAGLKEENINFDKYAFYGKNDSLPSQTSLPKQIQEYYGFTTKEGDYTNSRRQERCLVNDNDTGKSFKQIANIIEREPKGLFVK